MPHNSFAALRADIGHELSNVERIVAEAEEMQQRFTEWPNTVRVRTGGGILHDFYCGAERIFRHIATRVDQDLPSGPEWHIQLLHRMATGIETVRPAVLSEETVRHLAGYLRFRYLFRNIYGFELEWERCQQLLDELPRVYQSLAAQLAGFDAFLQALEHGA